MVYCPPNTQARLVAVQTRHFSTLAATYHLLAQAVHDFPAAQTAALAAGALVHIARPLAALRKGVPDDADGLLLRCCEAMEALLAHCVEAQVRSGYARSCTPHVGCPWHQLWQPESKHRVVAAHTQSPC